MSSIPRTSLWSRSTTTSSIRLSGKTNKSLLPRAASAPSLGAAPFAGPNSCSALDPVEEIGVASGCEPEMAMPELSISTEQVGFLIAKAREYDVKEDVSDPDEGSNA